MNKFKCPCCGNLSLEEEGNDTYEVCAVCGWEVDGVQSNDPEYKGGANEMSLNEAKEAYRKGKEIF